MDAQSNQELLAFHQFIGAKLANGGIHLSPEDVLDEWREQNPEQFEPDDDVEAIEAALADRDNGIVGMPLAEFDRKVRRKLKMPEQLKP
jgi:hypothetical protein